MQDTLRYILSWVNDIRVLIVYEKSIPSLDIIYNIYSGVQAPRKWISTQCVIEYYTEFPHIKA